MRTRARRASIAALGVRAIALTMSACGSEDSAPPLASVDLEFSPLADLGEPLSFAAHPVTGELFIRQSSAEILRFRRPLTVGSSPLERIDTPVDLRDTEPDGIREMLALTFSPEGDRPFANLTDVDGTTRTVRWDVVDGVPASERLTGELWIGDVGQEEIEEVHRLPAGGPRAAPGPDRQSRRP